MKWRLWHGRVDYAIRGMEQLLVRFEESQQDNGFSTVRLHSLGAQLLTYMRSNRSGMINYESATDPDFALLPLSPSRL